jgi:hypothetical protein
MWIVVLCLTWRLLGFKKGKPVRFRGVIDGGEPIGKLEARAASHLIRWTSYVEESTEFGHGDLSNGSELPEPRLVRSACACVHLKWCWICATRGRVLVRAD